VSARQPTDHLAAIKVNDRPVRALDDPVALAGAARIVRTALERKVATEHSREVPPEED
jgi:hypothetical protein